MDTRDTTRLFGLSAVSRGSRPRGPQPRGRGRRRTSAGRVVTSGLLVALLSGCGATAAGPAGTDPAAGTSSGPAGAASATTAIPTPTPPPDPAAAPAATPAPAADAPAPPPDIPRRSANPADQPAPVSAPVSIRVADLDIDMTIDAVGLADDQTMALPPNPAVAGWYRYGSGPGSAAGATVVAAHVDSLAYSLGPFARLADAPAGTEIVLGTADGGTHRYALASTESLEKPSVPWAAVFDRTGAPRLTLVTCGGEFDYAAKRYLSNVLVTAVPVP